MENQWKIRVILVRFAYADSSHWGLLAIRVALLFLVWERVSLQKRNLCPTFR